MDVNKVIKNALHTVLVFVLMIALLNTEGMEIQQTLIGMSLVVLPSWVLKLCNC